MRPQTWELGGFVSGETLNRVSNPGGPAISRDAAWKEVNSVYTQVKLLSFLAFRFNTHTPPPNCRVASKDQENDPLRTWASAFQGHVCSVRMCFSAVRRPATSPSRFVKDHCSIITEGGIYPLQFGSLPAKCVCINLCQRHAPGRKVAAKEIFCPIKRVSRPPRCHTRHFVAGFAA